MKRPLIPVLLLSFAMIPFGLAAHKALQAGMRPGRKCRADVVAPALLKGLITRSSSR